MSPMIDIQRRHAEVFRIRLGDKDGNRPRRLTDSIRITARSHPVVEAFTDVYGGKVTPWEQQWQAYLPSTELRVLVLPGQSIQQWWELYKGSVCSRRCDGYQEQKSGKRCMCPEDIYERAEDKDACSPTTRISVLCPDVAVVGAGGLVTHGMIAAETLPQSIAVAEAALSRGLMVPAILRVVVNDAGRNHFVYPQIEIVGTSINELASNEDPGLPHAMNTPPVQLEETEATPSLTPVPADLPTGPQRSVAEQTASPKPKPKRSNAAPAIPPSGKQRRAVPDEAVPPQANAQDASGAAPTQQENPFPAGYSGDERKLSSRQLAAIQAGMKELSIAEHDLRMEFLAEVLGRDVESTNTLTAGEASTVLDTIKQRKGDAA